MLAVPANAHQNDLRRRSNNEQVPRLEAPDYGTARYCNKAAKWASELAGDIEIERVRETVADGKREGRALRWTARSSRW